MLTLDFDPAEYPEEFELVAVDVDGTRHYRPRDIEDCGGCDNDDCCGACACCAGTTDTVARLRQELDRAEEWWNKTAHRLPCGLQDAAYDDLERLRQELADELEAARS